MFERALGKLFGMEDGRPRVRWHAQNLNEDHTGQPKGSMFWEGRGWLHFPSPKGTTHSASLNVSWCARSRFCHIQFGVGEAEQEAVFSVAFPPFAVWIGLEGVFRLPKERDLSLSIHDWSIFWNVWRDDNSWSRDVPRWRSGSWDFRRSILGDTVYRNEVLEQQDVVVPMPEGSYPATVKLCKASWSRPRWKTKIVYRAEVEMTVPIPHEGKGENPWDCGPDALHSWTGPAASYEEAIAAVVKSVLRSRRRYDGTVMAQYPPPTEASTPGDKTCR